MRYLKNLFFCFLIVFFANHVLPGISVSDQTKLPHLGGDLLFAVILGFLNSLVYPVLKLIHQHPSIIRMGIVSLVLNLIAYAILKLLPIGIHIMSVEGYILVSFAVTVASTLSNFFEMKCAHHKHPGSSPPPPTIQ